jgi:CheY-like chemotaxis protein
MAVGVEDFRAHLARLPSPAGIYDAARRYEYVNPSGVHRIGHDLASLLGQRDEDVLPPAVTDGYVPALELAAQTGVAQMAECTVVVPAGTFLIVATFVPLAAPVGRVQHILATSHDLLVSGTADLESVRAEARLAGVRLAARSMARWLNDALSPAMNVFETAQARPNLSVEVVALLQRGLAYLERGVARVERLQRLQRVVETDGGAPEGPLIDLGRSTRPLVVAADDSRLIRRLVEATLADDCDVLLAADGEEAWRLIQRHRPDVVVLDIAMPRRDGLNVARLLRAHPDLAGTPVLFMTTSTSRSDVRAAIAVGAVAYLTKPFSQQELRERVRQAAPHLAWPRG